MNKQTSFSLEIKDLIRKKNGSIKVLLADGDLVWQQRLAMLIKSESDIDLSNIVSTKEEAIQASVQLDVDVMILDMILNSPKRDGLDVLAEILRNKALPIIVLSSIHDPEVMVDAVVAGAVNYITKTNYLDIPVAIREAYRRQSSLHADVAAIIRNEIGLIKRKELQCMLTPTEKEILQLIGLGYRQTIIRELLGITSNTLKSHVRHITRKFDTRSIREAAEKAKRRGLYDQHYAT
ncbi:MULTISPECIES: response regulator transcription factor [Cohnella]|uniref:Response regulator transcription factor n=1 Tax=Cohnella xylanilytica TaxID=557555 RepID=A0A841UCN1_9BACL|nr:MULTISPECIES: response regulator transcription factor [Cohnella]MBB6695953.1 response regulator transcription factor [Cohnella xylanilytica]MCC3372217.1 response regulator transcription factor [Cohnella sp. REN36]